MKYGFCRCNYGARREARTLALFHPRGYPIIITEGRCILISGREYAGGDVCRCPVSRHVSTAGRLLEEAVSASASDVQVAASAFGLPV